MIAWLLKQPPEYLPLTVNCLMLARYAYLRAEPGKILYWLGARLVTVGLIKMRG
jgi:hypothetical protein